MTDRANSTSELAPGPSIARHRRSRTQVVRAIGIGILAATLAGCSGSPLESDRQPALLTAIPVGEDGFLATLSPDGTRLYVNNSTSGDVSVVDTATNTVTATIPAGLMTEFGAWPGVVSPDGARLYVTDRDSGEVSVIDTAANAVTATIPVGDVPGRALLSPDGSHLYV